MISGTAVFRSTWIFTSCRGIRRLPQNLLLVMEKHEIACFWLHLLLIQGFLGSFLILPFVKQEQVSLLV